MHRYNSTDWTDRQKNYAGMLTAADEGIGNVTRAIKEAGLWENILVIFTTDNGGPTESCCVQGSSNYPKRGGKSSLWEGGTPGDGFLSGPALQRLGLVQGQRFPHLFHGVDWFPTLAEMSRIVPRHLNELDGKSQWATLTGLAHVPTRNELFVGYVKNDNINQWYGPAVRVGLWKLVQGVSGGPSADDLNPSDRGEENDLALHYPDVVERLCYKLELCQQSYVTPQRNDDTGCPFTGLVNTSMGPTLMPWCEGAIESGILRLMQLEIY